MANFETVSYFISLLYLAVRHSSKHPPTRHTHRLRSQKNRIFPLQKYPSTSATAPQNGCLNLENMRNTKEGISFCVVNSERTVGRWVLTVGSPRFISKIYFRLYVTYTYNLRKDVQGTMAQKKGLCSGRQEK